ncbi:hypothetical protein [Nocardia rhizosphaerae]|uniref:DUF3168 domain-containing protein n=1 Tax=Nocardia rhizosphaerae TaxID=1691571 RepID=A0ABV8L989_9NOCA
MSTPMSTPLPVLLDELVALITEDAGLRASIDPRNINAPAVWVSARQIDHDILAGGTVTVDLWLIAPDTGIPNALGVLSEMLAAVLSVVDPDAPTSLAESVRLPDAPAPLPAFRVTVNLENC